MVDRDDQKRQVQDATDIIRLVGQQVALKPRGREFIGLCPFHDDHSPSMYVSPGKQIYKCFSCGAGGDVFSFVMNYHKMTFPEALQHLADQAGIALAPLRGEAGQQGQQGPTDRQKIAKANGQAVEFYQALLRHPEHGQPARDYIAQRGISPEMVEAFQLGYAADRWDGLAVTVATHQWDRQGFELAGLIGPRREGAGHYDRLRHRLIFPICDALGRPIAFGGRKLRAEDEPKYLNSPETALFNKSSTLYGLHLAKKAIIDRRLAVIVEGYTDVIACHQAGVTHVTATLGTALTAQHVAELRRYAQKVILVYDGDEAGQKAADRAVEVFFTGSLDVAIAVLPGGQDPAELLSQPDGLAQWQAAMDQAVDALVFQLERVEAQLEQTDTVTGREALVEEYLRRMAQLGLSQAGTLRRSMILTRLAELLQVSQADLLALWKSLTPASRSQASPQVGVAQPGRFSEGDSRAVPGTIPGGLPGELPGELPGLPRELPGVRGVDRGVSAATIQDALPAEAQLVGCLLRDASLFHQTLTDGRTLDEAIVPDDLTPSRVRELYALLYERLAEGEKPALREVVGDWAATGRQDLADLATTLEQQVEQKLMDNDEKLPLLLMSAAQNVLRRQVQREHQQTRQALLAHLRQGDGDAAVQEELLRRLTEQRRANPSTIRIARPGAT